MRTTLKARGDSTSAAAAAAFVIATLTLEYEIRVKVWRSTTGGQIDIEDSVNGFSASIGRASFHIPAGITDQNPQEFVIKKRDMHRARFGTTSAELRANLVEMGTGTINWEAWIDYPVAVVPV